MKKFFYIGMAIILILSVSLVAYGGWLNYRDENQIANRMEARSIELTCGRATKKFLNPVVDLESIKLYSENMTDAPALIDGRITEIFVTKNQNVFKGEELMELTNEQIPMQIQQAQSKVHQTEAALSQALSNVQRMEASLTNAENVFHRQERLMLRNATSKEKMEAAEAEFLAAQEAVRAAKAEVESARASIKVAEAELEQYKIQAARQKVISPIDGNILLIYKREGSYVQGGTPLALIGNFETLLFSTTLENANASYLRVGEQVILEFSEGSFQKAYDTEYSAGNLGKTEKFSAQIREITPPTNEKAVMRRILWEIDNRSQVLEPMTYNNVRLKSERGRNCLTVPLNSMADAENDLVFVVKDGIIERREVLTGVNDGTDIEILSGLNEGEIVVLESFEGLSDGMKIETKFEDGKN